VKSERAWAGIICGFFLFIVVCLSLLLHMKGAFRATGNPELGLLFFAPRCGGKLPLSRAAGTASAYRRDAGCTCLSGGYAAFLCDRAFFLAGTGVAV
jgi:predicted small integral membrane protein